MKLTVSPDVTDERIGGVVEQIGDVVVQRIHVLHQPLIGGIVDLKYGRVSF